MKENANKLHLSAMILIPVAYDCTLSVFMCFYQNLVLPEYHVNC